MGHKTPLFAAAAWCTSFNRACGFWCAPKYQSARGATGISLWIRNLCTPTPLFLRIAGLWAAEVLIYSVTQLTRCDWRLGCSQGGVLSPNRIPDPLAAKIHTRGRPLTHSFRCDVHAQRMNGVALSKILSAAAAGVFLSHRPTATAVFPFMALLSSVKVWMRPPQRKKKRNSQFTLARARSGILVSPAPGAAFPGRTCVLRNPCSREQATIAWNTRCLMKGFFHEWKTFYISFQTCFLVFKILSLVGWL